MTASTPRSRGRPEVDQLRRHAGLQAHPEQGVRNRAGRGVDIGLTREKVTGIMRTGDDLVIYRDPVRAPNGQQTTDSYAFKFGDPRIIEALKKDNVEQVASVLKWIATPTRWYGRLVTQFSPMFAPINLVRDIWERSELVRTRKLFDAGGQRGQHRQGRSRLDRRRPELRSLEGFDHVVVQDGRDEPCPR
jgi:hypothetical protein